MVARFALRCGSSPLPLASWLGLISLGDYTPSDAKAISKTLNSGRDVYHGIVNNRCEISIP